MFTTTYPNKVFDYMAAGRPTVLAIDGVIRQVVEAAGGDVLLVSLVPGQSTTRLVHRSAESAAPDKRVSKPAES